MRIKKLTLFGVFLIAVFCVSCTRKKAMEPSTGIEQDLPTEQEIGERQNTVSILYPLNSENMSSLSESEILEKTQILIKKIFSKNRSRLYRGVSRKAFSRYVYSRIEEDAESQKILIELRQNGVYFMTGSAEKSDSSSRYGDKEHISLSRNGLIRIMALFLKNSGETGILKDVLGMTGVEWNQTLYDGTDAFAIQVALEDQVDPVFDMHTSFSIHSTGVTINDPTILGGITTITHFWDPDGKWNVGSSGIWETLEKMIDETVGHADDIMSLIRPEYKAALLKNPPSAFYKALCLWYGWKEIQWKEQKSIVGADSAWLNKENIHRGITGSLLFGDVNKATRYLAHTVHLLMDMSVPAHVHDDPHGSFGGDDDWEAGVVKDVAREVIPNESYRFNLNASGGKENFFQYTAKNGKPDSEWGSIPGGQKTFLQMVEYYYNRFGNTYGLWPLFFNTAQATQFFPTFKGRNISKEGNTTGTAGNPSWHLAGADGFNRGAYNQQSILTVTEEGKVKTDAANMNLPAYSNGTYFLVYNNNGKGVFRKEKIPGTVQGYIENGKAYVYLGYKQKMSNRETNSCIGDYTFYWDSSGKKANEMAETYCSNCQRIEVAPIPNPMGGNNCAGPRVYLVIPPGGMYFEDIPDAPNQIKTIVADKTVLNSEEELTRAQINFTLKDLVKMLIDNNILPSGGKVEDLVEIKDGKVGLRKFTEYKNGNPIPVPFIRPVTVMIGGEERELDLRILNEYGMLDGRMDDSGKTMGTLRIYFIESPFDKMVEYLLPLTIATTTRLVRNYYRFYY